MKRLVVMCIAALTVLGAPLSAHAMTMRQYHELMKQHPDSAKLYILGVGEGLALANAALISKKRPNIFCVPNKLSLNIDNYTRILDSEYEEFRKAASEDVADSRTVSIVLYMGLVATFPCKK